MSQCSKSKQVFDKTDRLDQDVEEFLSFGHMLQNELIRNGFARYRDRILFTELLGNSSNKKQIFPNEKGDHFTIYDCRIRDKTH